MAAAVALSIRQLWAWAVCAGLKDVENRAWSAPDRGRMLIHAGRRATLDERGLAALARFGITQPVDLAFGAIIGEVELVDVVRGSASPWAAPGAVHWLVAEPQLWPEPVPYRGRQGVFDVELPSDAGQR